MIGHVVHFLTLDWYLDHFMAELFKNEHKDYSNQYFNRFLLDISSVTRHLRALKTYLFVILKQEQKDVGYSTGLRHC